MRGFSLFEVLYIHVCAATENASSRGIEDGIKFREKKKKKKERGKGQESRERCGMFMDHDFNPRASARRRSMLLIDPEKTKLRYAKAILYPLLLSASTIRLAFITTDDGFDRIYMDDDYVEIPDS
ncbi:hypothetical protein ACS0PU_004608 [Formica fusca]